MPELKQGGIYRVAGEEFILVVNNKAAHPYTSEFQKDGPDSKKNAQRVVYLPLIKKRRLDRERIEAVHETHLLLRTEVYRFLPEDYCAKAEFITSKRNSEIDVDLEFYEGQHNLISKEDFRRILDAINNNLSLEA